MARRRKTFQSARRSAGGVFVEVTGEILISVGLVFALFALWRLTLWEWTLASEQQTQAIQTMTLWEELSGPSDHPHDSNESHMAVPPLVTDLKYGEAFALLRVPRFGSDYVRQIAEGVSTVRVLNSSDLGVGRYPQSARLGEPGNFAIAAHRRGYGGAFSKLVNLRVGDRIYVEVEAGWYAYTFRNLEYVEPTDTEVLNAFPRLEPQVSSEWVITLTTCNPEFSTAERAIAYGVYEGWYPREDGPPKELSKSSARN